MEALVRRLLGDTFLRYFASSGMALGVDIACFTALVFAGTPAGLASAMGYIVGIGAHWLIASRAVFVGDVAERGAARTRQKAMFVLSALAGLLLTTLIVTAGAAAGFHLALTKGIAIGFSFTANWLIRRHFVFRRAVVA
ncbi:GtrA family protein [Tsuneonella sp. HG222]